MFTRTLDKRAQQKCHVRVRGKMSGPLLGNMSPEILSAEQSCSTSARQQPTISEGDKALMLTLQPNRCVCVCVEVGSAGSREFI